MFERDPFILVPANFVKFHIFLIFTYLKNFVDLALKIKKFKFWRARLGGPLIVTPQIQVGTSAFDIYNSSKYDPCPVCGLKGDSDRRKKNNKLRKNLIQVEINQFDHNKGRK